MENMEDFRYIFGDIEMEDGSSALAQTTWDFSSWSDNLSPDFGDPSELAALLEEYNAIAGFSDDDEINWPTGDEQLILPRYSVPSIEESELYSSLGMLATHASDNNGDIVLPWTPELFNGDLLDELSLPPLDQYNLNANNSSCSSVMPAKSSTDDIWFAEQNTPPLLQTRLEDASDELVEILHRPRPVPRPLTRPVIRPVDPPPLNLGPPQPRPQQPQTHALLIHERPQPLDLEQPPQQQQTHALSIHERAPNTQPLDLGQPLARGQQQQTQAPRTQPLNLGQPLAGPQQQQAHALLIHEGAPRTQPLNFGQTLAGPQLQQTHALLNHEQQASITNSNGLSSVPAGTSYNVRGRAPRIQSNALPPRVPARTSSNIRGRAALLNHEQAPIIQSNELPPLPPAWPSSNIGGMALLNHEQVPSTQSNELPPAPAWTSSNVRGGALLNHEQVPRTQSDELATVLAWTGSNVGGRAVLNYERPPITESNVLSWTPSTQLNELSPALPWTSSNVGGRALLNHEGAPRIQSNELSSALPWSNTAGSSNGTRPQFFSHGLLAQTGSITTNSRTPGHQAIISTQLQTHSIGSSFSGQEGHYSVGSSSGYGYQGRLLAFSSNSGLYAGSTVFHPSNPATPPPPLGSLGPSAQTAAAPHPFSSNSVQDDTDLDLFQIVEALNGGGNDWQRSNSSRF